MNKKSKVLLTGIASDEASIIESYIRGQSWFTVQSKYLSATDAMAWPSVGDASNPDIIVLFLNDAGERLLASAPLQGRAEYDLIVVGPANQASLMRLALKAGARDYIEQPVDKESFGEALRAVTRQRMASKGAAAQNITAVINTKGGSGGSFIAANLAHILATQDKLQTVLVDLDYQFGIQSLNFNLTLAHGLNEILTNVEKLDAVALKGYLAKHPTGMYLLGERLEPVVLPGDLRIDGVDALFKLFGHGFDHTVVDLPRLIDPLFSTVVARASHIVLVTQQSVAHVRDTRRLLSILRDEFDIAPTQITVVVNRHHDKATISTVDITQTLQFDGVVEIPNDYKRVVMSTDTSSPLMESAPSAPITKAMLGLGRRIRGEPDQPKTFFRRAFSGLFGG